MLVFEFFQRLCLVGIAVSTFFFTLVWQFAQFILLLESMAFFGTYCLGFIPKYKVRLGINNFYVTVPVLERRVCVFGHFSIRFANLKLFLFSGTQPLPDCDWLSCQCVYSAVHQWHDSLLSCTEFCCCLHHFNVLPCKFYVILKVWWSAIGHGTDVAHVFP